MSTKYPDLFAALAAPFEPSEVKVLSKGGRQIHYVTARTVMNRLDSVFGPENWWPRFEIVSADSVQCHLTAVMPDGREVTKCDLGGAAGMADAGDDDKSMASDALKRAGVEWGVGRYLYRDGVPSFVRAIATDGGRPSPVTTPEAEAATLGWVHGDPAGPARPGAYSNGHATTTAATVVAPARANGNGNGKPPGDGRKLFGWAKDQEQKYGVGLLKYLNQWGKMQDFPGRIVDWNAEQAAAGHAEACRKLATINHDAE